MDLVLARRAPFLRCSSEGTSERGNGDHKKEATWGSSTSGRDAPSRWQATSQTARRRGAKVFKRSVLRRLRRKRRVPRSTPSRRAQRSTLETERSAGRTEVGEHVGAGDLDIWTEQVGEGPDVLLVGGLGDTVESWQFQLDGLSDRYRLTAFDNRGAGRTAMPEGAASVEGMADDAAGVLRALNINSTHVAGFSGGSLVAQELALRHPKLVRSLV